MCIYYDKAACCQFGNAGFVACIPEPERTLSVSIPIAQPLEPLMGDTVVLPCYFLDGTVPDPGAPTIAPLSHRIKWSIITKEQTTDILVASEGVVSVNKKYTDRVQMVGYPTTTNDATIKITQLLSDESGMYRCEVMHGIEDSHDSVHIQVQGNTIYMHRSAGIINYVNYQHSELSLE